MRTYIFECVHPLRSNLRSFPLHIPQCHDLASLHVVKTTEAPLPEAYPINKLRNLAISLVETTHYFLCDIDMWPSKELYPLLVSLMKPSSIKTTPLFKDPKLAMIVPVFTYEVAGAEGVGGSGTRRVCCFRKRNTLPG